MRTSKVLSLSLPPELLRQAERAAKQEGRTKSDLFREALRRYLEERRERALQRDASRRAGELEAILRWLARDGRQQTRAMGLKPANVERLIQEYRREERSAKP